MFSQVKL